MQKLCDLSLGRTVQGHPRSKVMVSIDSPRVTSYLTSIDPNIVPVIVTVFKYLTCNFDDLELGQFKVIQGHRPWCQSISHGRFQSIDPIVLSDTVFEIIHNKAIFP